MLLLKNSQQKQRYSNLRFRCYVLPFILLGREVFDATGTIFGLRATCFHGRLRCTVTCVICIIRPTLLFYLCIPGFINFLDKIKKHIAT